MPEPLPEVPSPTAPSEPLLTVGAITAGVTALIALGVSFGLPVSDAQTAAILGVVAVFAPVLVATVGRSRVFAPDTVARLVASERQKAAQGR